MSEPTTFRSSVLRMYNIFTRKNKTKKNVRNSSTSPRSTNKEVM